MDAHLDNELERCRVIENIATNEFNNILDDVIKIVPSQLIANYELMQYYIDRLNDEEMHDVGAYLAYTSITIRLYTHFIKAIPIFQDTLTGKNPVSYSEYVSYQKMRSIFEDSQDRYEMLKDNTDLPYDKAKDYIDCMIEEFSIFSRIHQSKTIEMDELVMHIDWLDSVDPDAFNKLFLPEVPVELRKNVLDLQKDSEHRFEVLLSEILVNYELGLF